MYYIVSGRCHLKEIDIEIQPGTLVGEIGFLTPEHTRTQTIECLDEVHALTITLRQGERAVFPESVVRNLFSQADQPAAAAERAARRAGAGGTHRPATRSSSAPLFFAARDAVSCSSPPQRGRRADRRNLLVHGPAVASARHRGVLISAPGRAFHAAVPLSASPLRRASGNHGPVRVQADPGRCPRRPGGRSVRLPARRRVLLHH